MTLAGTYECVLETPMGKQAGELVVVPSADGETFTGSLTNSALGTVEIPEGAIDGDMLLCEMNVTSPMKMKIACEIIVDGDKLNGFVTAGMFGEMKVSGRRTG